MYKNTYKVRFPSRVPNVRDIARLRVTTETKDVETDTEYGKAMIPEDFTTIEGFGVKITAIFQPFLVYTEALAAKLGCDVKEIEILSEPAI